MRQSGSARGAAMIGAVVLLVSCRDGHTDPPPTVPPPPPCPIVASAGWKSTIGSDGRRPGGRIVVMAEVTFPSGGWRPVWGHFAQLDSAPPAAIVELGGYPTGGSFPVMQTVRGEWEASARIAAVTVKCGDVVLAQLRPTADDWTAPAANASVEGSGVQP